MPLGPNCWRARKPKLTTALKELSVSLIRITWLGLLILSAAMVAIASPAAARLALRPAEISPSGYSMSQVGFGCVIRAGV